MKRIFVIGLSGLLLSGCQSIQHQDVGTAVGAVTGAALGYALGDSRVSKRNAMVVGGLLGGYAGRELGAHFDRQSQERIAQARTQALETRSTPAPIQAQSGAVYRIDAVSDAPPPRATPQPQAQKPVPRTPPVKVATSPHQEPVKVKAKSKPQGSAAPQVLAAADFDQCRKVTQTVSLPSGRSVTDDVTFCKDGGTGGWVEV